MQANPCHRQCIVFLYAEKTETHTVFILFPFCNCVSFVIYYHIKEIWHKYNSREQNANVSPFSGMVFLFLSLSLFSVSKHLST